MSDFRLFSYSPVNAITIDAIPIIGNNGESLLTRIGNNFNYSEDLSYAIYIAEKRAKLAKLSNKIK